MRLWDLPGKNELVMMQGAQAEIEAVDGSSDGNLASCGSADKVARVYDLKTGI